MSSDFTCNFLDTTSDFTCNFLEDVFLVFNFVLLTWDDGVRTLDFTLVNSLFGLTLILLDDLPFTSPSLPDFTLPSSE